MGKYQDLVEDHLNARLSKSKVASNVLGVLRGEVETALKNGETDVDAVIEAAAKKMTKGLETVGGNQAEQEIEIISEYLPQTMSEDEVKAELDKLDLKSMSNFGQRMGTAMKVIGSRADGSVVKSVIGKYYN